MMGVTRPHDQYQQFIVRKLSAEYSLEFLRHFLANLTFWAWSMDLSQTASMLLDRYSSDPRGRKPRDPSDMLRSLLLMTHLKVTGVDDWVRQLRLVPAYAILSGFEPNDTPGVGTFYDFYSRLWLAHSPHRTKRIKRRLAKPKKKGKKNEKQEPKNPKITEKLVARIMRSNTIHYTAKAQDRLQQLFQTLFVQPSAAKGLLGDTTAFSVIGDGSPVETGGRAVGKAICDCRKKKIWKCNCHRQFSDPDADYGWDSYREKYYFGRTLYMFCAADSPYNLPVYPRLFRASQHDSVSWICGYQEFRFWYPQWNIGEAILDSAHDALPIYTMLEHDDVSAIIDLNPRRSGKLVLNDMVIGTDGVPVCPVGRKMINWGRDKKRYRHKYRCPAKIGGWECPTPCSSSDYGRTFHTSTKDNPRFFPRVCRGTKEWKQRFTLRTGVERCIKRQKIDYDLEASRGRSSRHWNIRVYLIAMCQHADAWLEEAKKVHTSLLDGWFTTEIAA
jgi:hypothetical protein